MAVAAAHGFVHRVGHGRLLRGWALAMRGDAIEGVAQIRQGLAVSQGEGLNLAAPIFSVCWRRRVARRGSQRRG
jgi:hypothetical protein